jgi:hypothetical protein
MGGSVGCRWHVRVPRPDELRVLLADYLGGVRSFTVASRLRASPPRVWASVSTLPGVNRELWPLARMTGGDAAIGVGRLGRSWVLLFGVLPIDYDDLCIDWLEEERGFRERSALLSAPVWHHDRALSPLADGGCAVVDNVAFEPRVRGLGGLQAFLFEAAFRWRHRRLRRLFGSP